MDDEAPRLGFQIFVVFFSCVLTDVVHVFVQHHKTHAKLMSACVWGCVFFVISEL